MSAGGAIFAMTAMQAVSSISEGYALKKEGMAQASLIESQSKLVDLKAGIEAGQYLRKGSGLASTSQANIAASGLAMQGSSLAVMLRTQRQINIDKAIGQFDYALEKSNIQLEAEQKRGEAGYKVAQGYAKALGVAGKGYTQYAMYKGW